MSKPAESPAARLAWLIDHNKLSPLVLAALPRDLLPALREYVVTTEARLAALEKPK
jgi:hypothetical protein